MPPLQSAYRRNHSTETALIKVVSDIPNAADVRKVTLLGLLDVSAAFDTVDHVILLRRLELSLGLGGSVLEWFRSFLANRSQAVTFHGVTSDYTSLLHGVPQGSVLGPLLFILYTADVALIAAQHGVDLHSYADDTQLHTGCSSTDASKSAVQLLHCINKVDKWMSSTLLRLNGDKTHKAWFTTNTGENKQDSVACWWYRCVPT